MFEKSVFDNLKLVRDKARRAMNLAFDDKKQSGAMISDVSDELSRAWSRVGFARSKMGNIWNDIQATKDRADLAWREYRDRQESYSRDIERAKSQQEYYHQESQRLFQQSRDAYNFGDKSMAPYYSQQAKTVRDMRNAWASEVRRLIMASKSLQSPKCGVDYSLFNDAKQEYYDEKARHAKIKKRYDELKIEHAENVRRFNRCREEFLKAKKAVDDYREKTKKESEEQRKDDFEQRTRMIKIGKEVVRLALGNPDTMWKYYTSKWEEQYSDSNCRVMVRSSYSKKLNKKTVEIMVIDKTGGIRDGRHWHSGYDEDGNEIFGHWKNKSNVENVKR